MKKGFTLIELLAVIVILAVIAIIATPAVLNIIEDSKKAAAEASARNIVGAAKTHYMQNVMDNKPNSSIDLSTDTLKYDGDKAKKGNLTYDANGNVSGKMYISGYCVEIKSDGFIASSKTNEDECNITSSQVTTYTNGTAVYYNPETNTKCSSSEAVSTTGTKTGCMKWYTFNDDGSNTVNLLLDHNTTATVGWATSGTTVSGPQEIKTQLESDTNAWNKTIKPRLIEASEITKITGYQNWNNNSYYFHDNTQTMYEGVAGTNKYAWLFDNTADCIECGCNIADSSNMGYWTGTAETGQTGNAWIVYLDGGLSTMYVEDDYRFGVRPVIEVDKSVLK